MRVSDYELLYDLPDGEYSGRGIDGIRTVTVRAGRSLEVMVHPITRLGEGAKREAKRRRTSPAMDRLNARNTQRHIMRLAEANFTGAALVVTATYAYPVEDYGMCDLRELSEVYDKRGLPWDVDRVRKDVRNWIAKMRRRVERGTGERGTSSVSACGAATFPTGGRLLGERGTTSSAPSGHLPNQTEPRALPAHEMGRALGDRGKADFKWIVRIEEGVEPPVAGLPPKYHIHALIEGPGLTRETVEALWGRGYTRVERFDINDDGPARLAKYLTKQRRGGRWWSHSRNLIAPPPRVSDRKMSRRRMARIAADVQREGRTIFEALYPGYKVVELPDIRFSDWLAGCYIYARLRRRE